MNVVRLVVVIGFAAVGLIGCGQGEDFGANTGCGRFNGLSPDDQARALKAMHIDRGKGTSEAEIATARDAARAHCTPGDIGNGRSLKQHRGWGTSVPRAKFRRTQYER